MSEEETKFHNEFKDWTKEEILSRAFTIATKNVKITKERDKAQNNLNELKKYVQEELREAGNDFAQESFIKVLDRIQELESE